MKKQEIISGLKSLIEEAEDDNKIFKHDVKVLEAAISIIKQKNTRKLKITIEDRDKILDYTIDDLLYLHIDKEEV